MSNSDNLSSSRSPYAKLRRQLRGMRDIVNCIAISPDSLQLAAGAYKGEVRIWDITDGSGIVLKQPDDGFAYCVDFSGNGRYLAAGIRNTAHIWTAKTGQPKSAFHHEDSVTSIVFSPDCQQLACGGKDINIWSIVTKQRIHVLKGHTNSIRGLSYFSNGVCLTSCSQDGTIRKWNMDQGETHQDMWEGHEGKIIRTCNLSPDSKVLASGGWDMQLILWDVENGEWLAKPYQGHTQWITSLSFSPDGQHIASASSGAAGEIHITDAHSNSFIAKLDGGFSRVVYAPNGKFLATVDRGDSKLVRVLALTTPVTPIFITNSEGGASSANQTETTPATAATLHPMSAKDEVQDGKPPPPYEGVGDSF